MTGADLTIRIAKATREDLPRVVELMKGLAEFEQLLDEFRVTEALLECYLFTREPIAELLVGCVDEEIRGYALFDIIKQFLSSILIKKAEIITYE